MDGVMQTRTVHILFLALLPPLALPAEVEFALDGGFTENGKPVQLIGNLIYELPTEEDYRPFPGEPTGWKWLYEEPPSRAQFDRLGFNATGGEVPTAWMRKYRPEDGFWQANRTLDWSIAAGYYKNSLPVWVDYTCAGWSHGGIAHDPKRPPAAAAFSKGDCHFLPYSLVTEEGLALYGEMWRSGAKELLAHGVQPFVYELFNEPAYDDRSEAAEEAFRRHLATLPTNRPTVADAIERRKFNLRAFAAAMARGRDIIREIDPAARTCFQPLQSVGFYICADIDLLAANRTTDLVVTPTGGGDAWDALILLAVAGKRPIVDGEAYLGATRASHRARILSEYARGLNGTYYFKWDRRAKSVLWKDPDAPAKLAEQHPYCALNPASVPPEAFAGLRDAASDIAAVNDLFTPRKRGIPASVAVLVSQPTIRLCSAEGRSDAIRMREAGEALLVARLPVKAIFEEQLDDGHLNGVKLLVAAGIDATLPETNARLKRWVEAGGSLIALGKKLDRDEWGRSRPEALVPRHENKRLGQGRVGFIDRRLSPRESAALYRSLAAKLGIRPTCRLTDVQSGEEVPEVECAAARTAAGSAGFILINHGLLPRAVRLRPVSVGGKCRRWVDVTTKEAIAQTEKGELLVRLPPEIPVILRGEPDGENDTAPTSESFMTGLSDWMAANSGSDVSTAAYWVHADDIAPVDLRGAANCALEGTFTSVPWGRQVFAGIPFEIIRLDQNGNRSGLALDKPSRPTPLDGAARSLAFLFTATDPIATNGTLYACELTYRDGSRATIEIAAPEDRRVVGWQNRAGKSLFVVRKPNPKPTEPLAAIDFKSQAKGMLLAAVSLERPTAAPSVKAFQDKNLKIDAWGGLVARTESDIIQIDAPETALDWSGVAADLHTPLALAADDIAAKSLVLEVTPGETTLDRPVSRPIPVPQFQLGYATSAGEHKRGGFVWPRIQIENGVWRTIRIPLCKLVSDGATALERLTVQFRPFGSERAGCRIRGIRIE